jgi:hypothetical protein
MAWVKLDDQFPEHPKVAKAGPLAMAMQVAALCYCNRKLTDGFVPRSIARTLLDFEVVDGEGHILTLAVTCGMSGDDMSAEWVIGLLLEAGMWEQVNGGYLIHDYHDYQPSKEEVESERASARDRMAALRSGRRVSSDDVRPNNGRSSSTPVPVPERSSSSRRASEEPPPVVDSEEDARFAAVWQEIARRKLEGSTNVKDRSKWVRKVIANDRAELGDEAWRLLRLYPTINVSQLAGCLMGERGVLRLLPRAIDEAS